MRDVWREHALAQQDSVTQPTASPPQVTQQMVYVLMYACASVPGPA